MDSYLSSCVSNKKPVENRIFCSIFFYFTVIYTGSCKIKKTKQFIYKLWHSVDCSSWQDMKPHGFKVMRFLPCQQSGNTSKIKNLSVVFNCRMTPLRISTSQIYFRRLSALREDNGFLITTPTSSLTQKPHIPVRKLTTKAGCELLSNWRMGRKIGITIYT